ncbi:sporulation histidine kinase inhibitor Sda [Chengkuizengella sediminis]|uniref:sporulation histidine kinase inhibitor Sda n=1 Tax=Chengkuizengella sediminis TaxID=1885917 RepID=UPI001389D34A|nr:sporulation histidine kinase inhibitor Sda [Chengkuizengella sediminis]NDI36792.1 sporulation histidine kinase inhibitor Sda [Chengkuizengella sediminis]
MKLLSDEKLLKTYALSLKLKLDQDFIQLLLEECNRRGLKVKDEEYKTEIKESSVLYSIQCA